MEEIESRVDFCEFKVGRSWEKKILNFAFECLTKCAWPKALAEVMDQK